MSIRNISRLTDLNVVALKGLWFQLIISFDCLVTSLEPLFVAIASFSSFSQTFDWFSV
jgi:hypothetical protein